MKKSEVIKALVAGAVAFIPGGDQVKAGVEALAHRNDDPDDDVHEISAAVTAIVMGAIAGGEFVSGRDAVNDAVARQLAANIESSIGLALLVVNKKAA